MLVRALTVISLVIALTGCAAAAIGGGTYAVKATQRDDLRPLAEAGDADAQYRLGKSWCCMGPGFDTQKATEWLCKAASQDHKLALFELGRIYDGEVSRTPAPGQKLLRLATAKRTTAHALAFFKLSAIHGNTDAEGRHQDLEPKVEADDRERAAVIASDFRSSCTYEDVFNNLSNRE